MSDKAIRNELEKLKEQVADLHSSRTKASAPQDRQDTDSAPKKQVTLQTEDPKKISIPVENEVAQDIEQQITDFIETLEEEISSAHPMTVLVVFSLGVLIGRLLPR